MKFFTRPFVFLTPIFCAGILIEDQFKWLPLMCYVLLCVALLVVLFHKRKKWGSLFSIVSLVFSVMVLGSLMMRYTRSEFTPVAEVAEKKEVGAVVEVLEVDQRDVPWRKVLGEISYLVGNDTMVEHQEKVIFYTNARSVRRYDQLYVLTTYKAIQNDGNPGEFDAKNYWSGQNVRSMGFLSSQNYLYIDGREPTFLEALRIDISDYLKKVLASSLDEEELSIASALILGDKTLLSPETKKQFSSAGAMHVLAVSGLHIGIILEILIFLLGRFPRLITRAQALIVALSIIWGYAALINFPSSVVRAALMFSFLVIGRIIGRESDSLNILFLSAFVMLLFKPLWIYDIGFQLSYLAMIGILTLYKPISGMFFIRNKWIKKVWEGTAVGIAAQLFTLPITLYYFHQFPNYFLLTNVGMMVFAGLVLALGLALFVFKWIPVVGSVVSLVLGVSLMSMIAFVSSIDALPGAVARGFVLPVGVVLIAYGILLALIVVRKRWVLISSIVVVFILIAVTQLSRYQSLANSEMVVFNANNVITIIKEKNQLVCVHNLREEDLSKAQMLAEAYRNVSGGEVTYHQLKEGETTVEVGGKTTVFTRILDGYRIQRKSKKKEYFVRTWHDVPPLDNDQIIDMPYQTPNKYFRNLKDGAIFLEFN